MTKPLNLNLDRSAKTSLSEQIRKAMAAAIECGVLVPGARLPSWQDLSVQLGVARGTVRTAYAKLAAAQLIEASRASGTRVAQRPHAVKKGDPLPQAGSFLETYLEMTRGPAFFQMGVPATDTFPATLFSRIHAKAARIKAGALPLYPDPRGEFELRREIASYLAVARAINCSPSQVIITGGFGAGLGLTLSVLALTGHAAWVENPGFPWSRKGLELSGLSLAPIPVDADGIDIDFGLRQHPDAKIAIVTPGQQAPLGPTMSLDRRLGLLEWASNAGAWVIEDDYLSELQLTGRAAPALASLDRGGRVIHIGSFSKTISPAIRLGFIVAPADLVGRFSEMAACLAPAPGPAIQVATAEFMQEGHYIRHLRRTKRAYAARQEALLDYLRSRVGIDRAEATGLAVLLRLPEDVSDVAAARAAFSFGMSPSPLSAWYLSSDDAASGLLLGVATTPMKNLDRSCDRLLEAIRHSRLPALP